jgi:hypothetical protein
VHRGGFKLKTYLDKAPRSALGDDT